MVMSDTLTNFIASTHGWQLADRLRSWDEDLFQHSIRAAILAGELGVRLGLGAEDREHLMIGTFLHDIGKTTWPKQLVSKQTLTEADWAIVRTHPQVGVYLVEDVWPDAPIEVLAVVGQHHERPDGSGYPYGLDRDGIHPLAEYAAVVECYTAMTETRRYRRKSLTRTAALGLLREQYRVEVVDTLRTVLKSVRCA